ncbi:MAG: hydrogenase expression/formation protein HypE [Proteobacteria bacterium]|nr:hydrogenase expression/formation protein HypE [Pseudomonadota bacterium]MBU1736578.1 hydrogenase expression/formation protein HypE [Pseudomonadota bacterium]
MNHDTVQLAHGSGGKLSAELVEKLFLPRFANRALNRLEDQAVLDNPGGRLAFSTDTFVVDPLFFPGGNIGDLAINGTVNDICMCGAQPIALSAGFILEEGLPFDILHRILLAMEKAAAEAGVKIVTGDTKVVPRGGCDKIFINTSGIGVLPEDVAMSATGILPGDRIILSGTVADHGMAVMTCREGLSFQSEIESDTAPLNGLVEQMLKVSRKIRAMRDPTRGGLATTLNEFAASSGRGIVIQQSLVPVRGSVQGACEILGIDPFNVANEGKLVAVVPPEIAGEMVDAMKKHPLGKDAVIIGEVTADHPGVVALKTGLGVKQVLDMPVGEQLPRIC